MTCMGIARIVLVKRRSVQVALVLPSLLLASGNLIQPLCLLWLCITIQGFNYNAHTSSRLFLLFPISLISCYSCLSAFISFPFHSSWLSTVSPQVLLCSTLFLSVISAPSWPSVVASIFMFLYFFCFFSGPPGSSQVPCSFGSSCSSFCNLVSLCCSMFLSVYACFFLNLPFSYLFNLD